MFNSISSRYQRLFKESVLTIAANIISVVSVVILLRITASALTAAQYGNLALLFTFSNLISKVGVGGLLNATGRYYPIAFAKKNLTDFYFAVRFLWQKIILVVFVAFCSISFLLAINNFYHISLEVFLIMLFAVSESIGSLFNIIYNAKRDRKSALKHKAISSVSRVIATYLLLKLIGTTSLSVVVAYALSSAVSTLLESRKFAQIFQSSRLDQPILSKSSQSWESEIWLYSWPFCVWGIFTWLQEVADKWSLQAFFGADEVALYAILFQLGVMPLLLLSGTINQFLMPIINNRATACWDQGADFANVNSLVKRTILMWIGITLLGAIVSSLYSESLLYFVAAQKYKGGHFYLPFFVLIGGLQCIFQVVTVQLNAFRITKERIKINIISSLFTTTLTLVGAKYFGIEGVIAALMSSFMVRIVWSTSLLRKVDV